MHKPFASFTLLLGAALPILYYGAQVLAAPFYPGFSLLKTVASDLGSGVSRFPLILNAGAFLCGLAAFASVYGFVKAFREARVNLIWIILFSAAVVGVGFSCLWAAVFPLPHPRHAANPFTLALLLTPLVTLLTFWRLGGKGMKIYLLANLILFLGLALIFSGAVAFNRQAYEGLLQRVLTLTIFVPNGVGAYRLRKQLQTYRVPSPNSTA
jgi:hypothetical membrane protein